MEIKIKVCDLDKPNRNNLVFTKEAIESAYKNLDGKELPLVFIGDDDFDFQAMYNIIGGNVLGTAQITNLQYPAIELNAKITNDIFKEALRKNLGGFGPNYLATIEPSDNDIKVVSEAKISTIGYTLNPASVTSFEIIRDTKLNGD